MAEKSNQKNILFFLVSIIFLNISIGFYNSVSKKALTESEQVNFSVMDKSIENTSLSQIDFINEANEMIGVFEKHDFSIDSFINNESTDLIIFSSLPKDFMAIQPIQKRKDLFIQTLVPIIFVENKKILEDRQKILEWWRESEGDVYSKDFWPSWLFELSESYNSNENNLGNLLMKVDVVPISLALAQAAIESGWGSSRYLREGNAVYGQYTFDQDKGIVPKQRDSDKKFLVRKFNSLSDATRSYLKNLNTHKAYTDFRYQRRNLRMSGDVLSGTDLANFLTNYSERKNDYVKDLKNLINTNNFMKFDAVYF
tara:strand:- start:1582 stop:2517 length:936 start_codon:yes stop_codon:yes gene_type:complete